MIRIQRWLIFSAGSSSSYIAWWCARNDVVGYMKGIPPALADRAAAESWTLPHIFEETVNVEA